MMERRYGETELGRRMDSTESDSVLRRGLSSAGRKVTWVDGPVRERGGMEELLLKMKWTGGIKWNQDEIE